MSLVVWERVQTPFFLWLGCSETIERARWLLAALTACAAWAPRSPGVQIPLLREVRAGRESTSVPAGLLLLPALGHPQKLRPQRTLKTRHPKGGPAGSAETQITAHQKTAVAIRGMETLRGKLTHWRTNSHCGFSDAHQLSQGGDVTPHTRALWGARLAPEQPQR